MTPADVDRVFGRGRLRMVTGDHVEVYREESAPGERRRYTKRFLATAAGDFRPWTEREWRILARLVGHGIESVPDVVQFDRGAAGRAALVQTYDAGITVDHWATLLPVQRDGQVLRHVFEDWAHWWALARHCLIALDAIHALQLVHLDLKADNVCIPVGPPDFDPWTEGERLYPRFEQTTLIDFAFSLVSGEPLESALPIAAQPDYDYQSPRLLQALEAGRRGDLLPTRELDWRCDLFSLAAMLRRCLPDPDRLTGEWTAARYAQARALVRRLVEWHDAPAAGARPHAQLIAAATQVLSEAEAGASLQRGWTLAVRNEPVGVDTPTPVTRVALPVNMDSALRADPAERIGSPLHGPDDRAAVPRTRRRLALLAVAVLALAAGVPLLGQAWLALQGRAPAPLAQAAPASAPAAPAEPAAPVPLPTPAPMAEAPELAHASDDGASAVPRDRVGHDTIAPEDTQQADASARGAVPARALAAAPSAVAAKSERAGVPRRRSAPVAVTAPQRPRGQVAVRPSSRSAGKLSERDRALAYLSERGPAPLHARAGGALPPVATAPASPAPVAAVPPARSAAAEPAPIAPAAAAPSPVTPAIPAGKPADDPPPVVATDFAARARELMEEQLPRAAQRAERLVLRVLFAAARSVDGSQDDVVRDTASSIQRLPDAAPIEVGIAAGDARSLNEAARVAYDRRASLQEAFALQSRAFGANPLDAEVVGNLAYLYLKQRPVQPEAARQLALYALTLRDPRHPGGRLMDWTTLAIASALSGRERDSRNAWFVTLALGSDIERHCRVAIDAYAAYGERLRPPVEAMLYRIHTLGRGERSPTCEWPPQWTARSTTLRR